MPGPYSSSFSARKGERVPSIKGLVFKEFVRWFAETRGREATLRAHASLPDELRAHLDPDRETFGILAGSWYPSALVSGLLEAITWGLAPEDRSGLLRAGVNHSIGVTLTGVYKVLFQTLVTPERHAKYAQKIWDNYYNTGTVVGRMLGENRSEQWVTDWPGHHPLLCELSIWSLTCFHEHMGCTKVKVSRSACVLDSRIASRTARRPPSSATMRAARPLDRSPPPPPSSSSSPLAPPPPPSSSSMLAPASSSSPLVPRSPSSSSSLGAAAGAEIEPAGCRFLIQWQER